jgi:hypothetical protein
MSITACQALLHSDAASTMKALRISQARSSVWLERFLDTEEVDGSSPFGPTIIYFNALLCVLQAD